jgi:proton-dependent oligopeptide transporter, POT family
MSRRKNFRKCQGFQTISVQLAKQKAPFSYQERKKIYFVPGLQSWMMQASFLRKTEPPKLPELRGFESNKQKHRIMDFALGLLIFGWIFVIVWTTIVVYTQKKVHPKALFALFFTEMWERFSFYGMRALLILYLTHELFAKMEAGEADARAYGVYGAYNALLYAAPIIGGWLADRLMGFRKAVLMGGIFMAVGQFTLAASSNQGWGELVFFMGLGLLTVGNGFFKPNISSFLGTFYDRNDKRKDSAFTIFYMGINIGAFLAPITCGYLGQRIDWSLGFLVAGIGMVIGLVQFWYNMRDYEDKGNPPDPKALKTPVFAGLNKGTLIVIASLIFVPIFSFLIDAEGVTNYILFAVGIVCIGYILITSLRAEDKVEGQRMIVFLFLFFFHMIFWALFEQAGGSLTILAERHVNLHGMEASQLQSLNPLYIILLAPVFAWIWAKLGKAGREPRTPIKFFFGLAQMALGYFVIVWGIRSVIPTANGGELVPFIFLLGMYLFHTTGELSLSPVGLSVVTKLSPAKVVGFVMGAWFLSIAFAHKIAGELGKIIAEPGADADAASTLNAFADVYMTWGVYVVLGAAGLLLLFTPLLKKWMHGVH